MVLILVAISCMACLLGIAACTDKPAGDGGNGQGSVQTPPEEKPDDAEKPSEGNKPTEPEKPTVVEVTGVTLNNTTLLLEVGDAETLTATVAPNNATDKTVIWKSSEVTVAKVENGKVTALKAGTATITAMAGSESATCKVTVIGKPLPHMHQLTLVPAKPVDCEEDGSMAYYTCVCGKWFSDYAAKNEITDKNTVTIKATGHSYSKEWTSDETQHWHKADCKHIEKISDKSDHNFADGICTECGYDSNKYVTLYTVSVEIRQIGRIKIDSYNKIQPPDDIKSNPDSEIYYDGWFYDKDKTKPVKDFIFTKNTDIYTTAFDVANAEYFTFETVNGEATITGLSRLGRQQNLSFLKVLVIPRRYNELPVTGIGDSVFKDWHMISLIITNDIKTIDEFAFRDCDSLQYVIFSDGLKNIGKCAFFDCDLLRAVTLPDGLNSIGEYAFSDCVSMRELVIPKSVASIGKDAFYHCGKLIVYCEAAAKPSGWDSQWSYTGRVIWDCRNNDKDKNGFSYTTENGIRYAVKDEVADIIEGSDFDSVIPATITYKGKEYKVTSIGSGAFMGCSLWNITIPDSVTTIDGRAFRECTNLKSITLYAGLTSIGEYAFSGCTALKSITFYGTSAQWRAIKKGVNWNYPTGDYIVYCDDWDIHK